MITKQQAAKLASFGLTARLVETDEPDVEDDQIDILRDGRETGVSIQVGQGYFFVNHHSRDASGQLVIRGHGRGTPWLSVAIAQAIAVVETIKETP